MIEIDRAGDGRVIHTFRQSTLGELDICPERGRATLSGDMPKILKDATCMGTAVHSGIEAATLALDKGIPMTPDDITNIALAEFDHMVHQPNFLWVKYGEAKARALIERAVERFYDDVYHLLHPQLVEHQFGPLVVYEDAFRVIQVTGTIDLYDRDMGAVDYKNTGDARKYKRGRGGEAWKLDRWAVQPTVYHYALRELECLNGDGPWPFTYFVFDFGTADVELVQTTVYRQPADFSWLRQKVLSYAHQVEAETPVWPKQDNHALCSEKWCDWWHHCKGLSYVDVEWPIKGS